MDVRSVSSWFRSAAAAGRHEAAPLAANAPKHFSDRRQGPLGVHAPKRHVPLGALAAHSPKSHCSGGSVTPSRLTPPGRHHPGPHLAPDRWLARSRLPTTPPAPRLTNPSNHQRWERRRRNHHCLNITNPMSGFHSFNLIS